MASRNRRAGARGRWTRAAIVAVIVVMLVSGGGVAYAKTRSSGPSYRTASVQNGSATHALVSTGTIGPALQSTVTFPAAGTVASVDVKAGQHVVAGAVLAELQTTTQAAAVTSAQSTLANAQLTLYQAENGESSTQTSSGTGSTARSASVATTALVTGSGNGTSGSGATSAGGSAAIVAAQKKLLASQQKIDKLLAETKTDLALAGTLCTALATTGTTSAGTGQSQPATTPTPTPGGGKGPGGSGPTQPTPTTCSGALQLVLTDQTTALTLEEGLSQQEAALNKLLSRSTGSTSGSTSGSKSGSSGGSSGTGASGSSGTATAVSASQLAADQAAVDAAKAELLVAQQNLAQATIVSPIAGTVVGLGLTVGQRAGTTSGIQIVGSSAHVVTTDVSVTNIATVKVGQSATVTPDGSATPLAGKVLEISVAPVSGSSTSFMVTVGLTGSPAGLHNGATAAVSMVTGQATGAVVVPTSAVHYLGSFAFVTVLSDSTTSAVPVTVGVVGPAWTTVTVARTGSLPVGAEVVLADLSEALPSSNTTTVRTGLGAGRFAGGAGFAGGGTGRAPTG